LSEGRLLGLLGGSQPVLTDDSLGDILTEPCVDSFPVTLMGQMTDYVRGKGGHGEGFRGVKL